MSAKIHGPFVSMALVLMTLLLAGCQQSATEPAAPAAGDAEVPQPGPAVEDPGPAPAGQWEPPVEPETPETGTPEPDAAASESSASEPPASETPAAETPSAGAPAAGPEQSETATESNDTAVAAGDAETSTVQQAAPGENAVTLKLQSWDQTEKLIASHKGKIVVVDFWATSCLPCRREFPHLVALQKAYPEKVACVSVSLDYSGRKSRPPEVYTESVLEFLNQQQATIDNVLSTDDPDELEQRLKLAPIPLVWVYDRDGERRQTFDNGDLEGEEFTYEKDVVPFVESLLSES